MKKSYKGLSEKLEKQGTKLKEKERIVSRLVRSRKEFKTKEKKTKDSKEKVISSSQGIPLSFNGGCNSLSTPFFYYYYVC